jgi:hypothetical protein
MKLEFGILSGGLRMFKVERVSVASGIIGKFSCEWIVVRLQGRNKNDVCYDLFIGNDYIDSYPSVAKALIALAEQFEEDEED